MSRTVRGLIIAGGAVLLLVVLVFGAWLWLTRRPYPQTRGSIRAEGLSAPVEVLRDRYGVPHIYARSAEDLFFAQGFVHAQDRFWQMEFWRRISSGRLSELFGKSTLETDKFMRTLGFHRIAEREFEQLSPNEKRYFESYAAGVNAYILHRRPANTLTWLKVMSQDLGANMDTELLNLDIVRSVGTGMAANPMVRT